MKNVLVLMIALVAIFASCKKKSAAPPTLDPIGTWSGTFTPNNGTATPVFFKFSANGVLMLCYTSASCTSGYDGTWKVSGNDISGTYVLSGAVIYYKGTVESDNKTYNATYGVTADATGSGTMTLTKQ